MHYTTALRQMYVGTIKDTTELALVPLLKSLPEPLLTPLMIYSLSKPEPLPVPIWEHSNKPSFDSVKVIVLPNIKHVLLLIFIILNFLLLSRVLKGLYKLYTILPIQLLTLLLLTLHFLYIIFTF